MGQTLQEGMTFEFVYIVPPEKTVPHLFSEFPEGGRMPEVLATGFLVGLLEFACIKFINPHTDRLSEIRSVAHEHKRLV